MFIPPHLLVHLPYLAQVARFNSFTRAAETLHVTQAAVSYQIRQLEEKTGNLLVLRQSGGKTQLTGAGRALVAEYNICAKRLRLALDSLAFETHSGMLRISTPLDFGSLVMPAVIAKLAKQAPLLKVVCHTSDEVMQLNQSDWDMAITSVSEQEQQSGGVLYSSALRVVASAEYLASNKSPNSLEDLHQHSLLLRQGSQNNSWRRLLARRNMDLASLPRQFELGNTFALLEGAKKHLGLAILPNFCVAESLSEGKLTAVLNKETDALVVRFKLRKIDSPQTQFYEQLLINAFRDVK